MKAEVFFISITSLYFLTYLFLYKGFRKSLNLQKRSSSDLPRVSVIVAARNEEQIIARCILSLSALRYPEELLEVILVDDHSTDKTLSIMKNETQTLPFFKVLSTIEDNSFILKGKAKAIDTAIKNCSGEIIISTDADCEIGREWVHETVKYYSGHTAMVCGFTQIKSSDSLFAKMQNLDWLYLLTLASASAGLKMIMSCVGNNLSFTKAAYKKVGGYESINFSVTEDLALMRKINSDKKFEIKYPVDKSCLVETLPCKSLDEVLSQKRRWFKGGTGINMLGYLVGIELYALNFLFLFGLFFLNYKIYLPLIVLKMMSELILVSQTLKRFDLQSLYKYYLFFSIYFALYGLILPFTFLLNPRIKWKGRKF